ncbi:MAG: NAD(+) synthase [Alphaproteobacteria bacterium]|nr:NAD(+) synthase [Alphaproteobacteria bacterium]MCB9699229.1 NAD(+) synthase [Alphaproteobacteria bacterium]
MSTPLAAHVAAATLNQTVGDWAGNTRRILAAIAEARRRGAKLLVLPEMCIPGYSLGDRLMMRGTLDRSLAVLRDVLPSTRGMVVLVGLPLRHRDVLYNVVAVCADGRVVGVVPKENLATGDVQYENRWFSGWPRGHVEVTDLAGHHVPMGSLLFDADGIGRFGVEICEDGWKGIRPGSLHALGGAHIVANPSASWFTLGKHRVRRHMVEQISREDHVVYLYTSLLGCDATRLIFDGSVFVAQDGGILAEGRRFVFDEEMELIDRVIDLGGLERARMEEGSWRQQVESLQRGELGEVPQVVRVEGDFGTDRPPPAVEPYWLAGTETGPADPSLQHLYERGLLPKEPTERDLPHLELELALAMGLREYRKKCGIPGFALALSGGRDSTMVGLLVARAIAYDHPELKGDALKAAVRGCFTTAYMATENSGDQTREAARRFSEEIGAEHLEANIQAAVDTHVAIADAMMGISLGWGNAKHDVPLQNVQARLRGSLIWMVANLRGYLLLATSNKSEAAVGYATMDGDTSGGLSPIADVPKSLIGVWLDWAERFHGLSSLGLVTRVPATAELRPPDRKQTDEDDLMPFFVLDQLMFHFVQRGQDPVEMFRTLWPALSERYEGDPRRFATHIRKFVRMFCAAQWKRERFAISFRVAAFDLDPKTGFRFPPVQSPFTEELAELDRYVAELVSGG